MRRASAPECASSARAIAGHALAAERVSLRRRRSASARAAQSGARSVRRCRRANAHHPRTRTICARRRGRSRRSATAFAAVGFVPYGPVCVAGLRHRGRYRGRYRHRHRPRYRHRGTVLVPAPASSPVTALGSGPGYRPRCRVGVDVCRQRARSGACGVRRRGAGVCLVGVGDRRPRARNGARAFASALVGVGPRCSERSARRASAPARERAPSAHAHHLSTPPRPVAAKHDGLHRGRLRTARFASPVRVTGAGTWAGIVTGTGPGIVTRVSS